jgi:hypothetical protein
LLRETETADHTGEVVSGWDKRKMGGALGRTGQRGWKDESAHTVPAREA